MGLACQGLAAHRQHVGDGLPGPLVRLHPGGADLIPKLRLDLLPAGQGVHLSHRQPPQEALSGAVLHRSAPGNQLLAQVSGQRRVLLHLLGQAGQHLVDHPGGVIQADGLLRHGLYPAQQRGHQRPAALEVHLLDGGQRLGGPLQHQLDDAGGNDRGVLGVVAEKAPGRLPRLNVLGHQSQVWLLARLLQAGQHNGQVLPAPGGHQGGTVLLPLADVEVFLVVVQVGQHHRMDVPSLGIGPPGGVVRDDVDQPHPAGGDRVQGGGRPVVLRGVARQHQHPPVRDGVGTEGLVLQQLEHDGPQRLGGAVELIQEEDALLQAGLLHGAVDLGDDFAHGVLGHGHGAPLHGPLDQPRQADDGLSGVVGDGVGQKGQPLVLSHLADDLRLAHPRRTHQAHGPGPAAFHAVAPPPGGRSPARPVPSPPSSSSSAGAWSISHPAPAPEAAAPHCGAHSPPWRPQAGTCPSRAG